MCNSNLLLIGVVGLCRSLYFVVSGLYASVSRLIISWRRERERAYFTASAVIDYAFNSRRGFLFLLVFKG